MRSFIVTAPGKIHLLGEHAVVYGKPALLASINRRVKIILTALVNQKSKISAQGGSASGRKNQKYKSKIKNKIILIDNTLKIKEVLTVEEIYNLTKGAREKWEEFNKTGEIEILKRITRAPLDLVKISTGEAFSYYRINNIKEGFTLEIESEIPIGAGLGSSSAIAAAVVSAVTLFLNKPFDKKIVNEIVYKIEQRIHGNPSGGDNAMVVYGGLIWYQKVSETKKIIKSLSLKIPQKLAVNFLLIDTGKPVESTGEMVAWVRKLYNEKPDIVNRFLNNQEKLVEELLWVVNNGICTLKNNLGNINRYFGNPPVGGTSRIKTNLDSGVAPLPRMTKGFNNINIERELIKIIREGERNLESIGVVSSYVGEIIRQIEQAGGCAKICGGGGKTKGTGILLCYHKKRAVLKDIAHKYRLKSMEIGLGGEGIKIVG